jgi:hypothetical protein
MCRSAILEFPIAIRGCFPFGNNPSLFLQTVQRRIERAVLHFKEVISSSLNMFAYLMSVRWTVNKCSQNEHVHRSSADVHWDVRQTGKDQVCTILLSRAT